MILELIILIKINAFSKKKRMHEEKNNSKINYINQDK